MYINEPKPHCNAIRNEAGIPSKIGKATLGVGTINKTQLDEAKFKLISIVPKNGQHLNCHLRRNRSYKNACRNSNHIVHIEEVEKNLNGNVNTVDTILQKQKPMQVKHSRCTPYRHLITPEHRKAQHTTTKSALPPKIADKIKRRRKY